MLWEMGQISDQRQAPPAAKPSSISVAPAQQQPRRMGLSAPSLGTAELTDGATAFAVPIQELDLGGRGRRGTSRRPSAPPPAADRRRAESSDDTSRPRPSADERGLPTERRSPLPAGARTRRSDPAPAPAEAPTSTPSSNGTQQRSRLPVPPHARAAREETRQPSRPSRSGTFPPPSRPSRLKDRPRRTSPEEATQEPAASAEPAAPARDDDRELVIKRRTQATPEPLPNPMDTAAALREISQLPVKVTRKERRARRKADDAAAKKARDEAMREAKRQAKAAKKAAKKGAFRVDAPEQEELLEPGAPTGLDTAETARERNLRRSWRERKAEKLLDALGAVEGEEMVLMVDGRARLRSATLIVTTYRVATISRGARKRVLGWIPLEEIERVKRVWRGADTMHIEGSFERLSFQGASHKALREARATVKAEVKEARRGATRHHPDVIQLWCERTNEIWESDANRVRLWIRKHPIFTVAWLGSMIPVAYVGAHRLF